MPTGLVALLDDIAAIAKTAAASLDDMGAAAGKAAAKASGVVVDDAAVTPAYVNAFTPERELPVIWKITKGSLRNKLVFLLPAALLLSQFLPAAITPLLMLGGLYLSYEGAEKVGEMLGGAHHGATLDDPIDDPAAFERERVSGAVRTDLILSAEIMAIALASVAQQPLFNRAAILVAVAVAMTALVYGAVALIVKMDDIGLHLARRPSAAAQTLGCGLVRTMPRLLSALGVIGTLAMLWVGGGILVHGCEELGWQFPAAIAHGLEHALDGAGGIAGAALGWLGYAVGSAVIGLASGAIVAALVHFASRLRRG